MALSSASPQIANVKDGEKSPPGDLEEGEIEDGELPDEEGETETVNTKSKDEQPHGSVVRSVVKVDKLSDKHEKSNDASLSRLNRRKTHHNPERNNDQEEEWACVVEKQLKAAMSKDSGIENFNGSADVVTSEKTFVEEDKRSRRKKRKKKHKDDDEDDKKESKKRKKSHHWGGEEGQENSNKDKTRDGEDRDEDDDEMLFVRGASPVAREGFSRSGSPSSKFVEKGFSFNKQAGFEETYDSYNEGESDFESREEFSRCKPTHSDDETPKRGLGRGAKRRQRTVGRPLPHNKRQTRKDTKSKRGGLKRQQSSRSNSEREPNVCMFYMQGKCQKGEECPYSHNVCPPRKMELCKFYLMDCCAKKDKCLYMHHDFPCKFFHTGLKCFSGPRCKFSHGQLSEAMRSILLKGTEGNRHNELRSNRPSVPSQEHRSKHLETAPKELLGDFPRLSREGAAAMVYSKKNRTSKAKKIPSLLDIEIPIPVQLLADQKEGSKDQSPRRTPMPESDNEDQDGTTTPMPLSPVNDGKSKSKNRWGSDDLHGSLSRDSKDDNLFREEEEDGKPLLPKFYQEADSEGGNKNKSDVDLGIINLHRFAGYSPNHADDKKTLDLSSTDKTGSEEKESKKKTDDKPSQKDSANGDSGTESNDAANIPLHLPKKQRELFLRIQQQQRVAESSQDRSGDHDDEMEAVQEENWYSSDDEEDSLTNVLKNLSKQGTPTSSQVETSCPAKEMQVEQKTSAPPLPMKIPDLSKIKIDESVTKLLSSICGKKASEDSSGLTTNVIEQSTPQVANVSVARDPRLSRDPRSRSHTSATTATIVPTTSGSGSETAATSSSTTTSTTTTTTTTTTHSSSYESNRRTDPRRVLDPRSAKASQKSEDHKHSSSSSSGSSRRSGSHSSSFPNIYSNAIMGEKTSSLSGGLGLSGTSSGDIDLRNFLPRTLETGDVDLRSRSDTDLRTGQTPTTLGFGDTDLRVRSHDPMNVGQIDSGRNNSDVDLRRLELPFKPVPMHTPATEIEASLTSHPPFPYKVVVVTIPRPDYSNLKLNTSDPQVQSDPRLRKIFKLQSPGSDNPSKNSLGSSISSVSRSDPRRQSTRSSNSSTGGSGSISNINNSASGGTSSNTLISNEHHEHSSEPFIGSPVLNIVSKTLSDKPNSNTLLLPSTGLRSGLISPASSPLLPNPAPRVGRDPRSAPGLLGPAPLPVNYCPNTPLFDEHVEMGCGIDSDPRVMFNRGSVDGARWEQHSQGSSHVTRNSWRSNRRNTQSRYNEDPRSYTPPI